MLNRFRGACGLLLVNGVMPMLFSGTVGAADKAAFERLAQEFQQTQQPVLQQFCQGCHSTADAVGELNLEQFASLKQIRQQPVVWQKVAEMLDNGEMPPDDADQLSPSQRQDLRTWVQRYLDAEALAQAGDPGPVVLRRLNNAEYTYTIQDLTSVPLQPATQFPVDSAAGEGFTNTGNALVMSPALVQKYLDAAREIGSHAVLLPDGFRFSGFRSRRDWTNEQLDRIRSLYSQYCDSSGGETVNLQGVIFHTNGGGRLPLENYLTALLTHREALVRGQLSLAEIAARSATASPQLSEKYLTILWQTLQQPPKDDQSSLLLDQFRQQWATATVADVPALLQFVSDWQQSLWRFTTVGHIGKRNGPTAWLEPVNPIVSRQEIRIPLSTNEVSESASAAGRDVVLYLSTTAAGDQAQDDLAVWERPRLVIAGREDLLLRDVRRVTKQLQQRRRQILAQTSGCLAAAAQVLQSQQPADVAQLSARFDVAPASLAAWFRCLGIGRGAAAAVGPLITGRMETAAEYDFVKGWVGDDALSVVANSSDQHVRIPGNLQPHSVAVHPAPTRTVAIGWRSPVSTTLTIDASIQHAHPECGNGTAWSVELRRGILRQRLAAGISHGATVNQTGPLPPVVVSPGDLICLLISPRDGNHSCDLTAIDLNLRDADRHWNLASDLSSDLLAGNPHADQWGNEGVWHFFSEPAGGPAASAIPPESLLAKWQNSVDQQSRQALAEQIQQLLETGPDNLADDSPDRVLYSRLSSFNGPLLAASLTEIAAAAESDSQAVVSSDETAPGLNPTRFGPQADVAGTLDVDSASLLVRSSEVIEVRLPAELAVGAEFVTSAMLHQQAGPNASVQMQVLTSRPEPTADLLAASVVSGPETGAWTSRSSGSTYQSPVIVRQGSRAAQRMQRSFEEFRQLFPAAACYTRIVPVDEVVTLTLYYREDDHLQRLVLDDQEVARLNRLWDELHYISRSALVQLDAFEQLLEFATQDGDPSVFAELRQPLNQRAAEFRQTLKDSEPRQLTALLDFAAQAWRRDLTAVETQRLQSLYDQLRAAELSHEEAFAAVLHRILVAPAFLYRLETPGAGTAATAVSDWELASRLSYFLWSSAPDQELRSLARAGRLSRPEVLKAQTQRMLQDDRVRRLATECFCQWLQIYDFDQLDEKSERHFPTFTEVRPLLYEEAIVFFTDLLQQDQSLLNLFDADYTFLNAALAQHYGIPGIDGDHWRRVDGMRQYSRGGILGLGSTLARHSGASRTSPILRGTWLSEVVLGEKLPKPPPGVPLLPEDEAVQDLTMRQLVQRHTSDERCAGCHRRIDPYGFSLEAFDAIGRLRTTDLGGRPLDTSATLIDGTVLNGQADLKQYLLTTRRDAVLKQVCRKLLGYALGRAVQLSDEPLLEDLQLRLQQNDYHVSVAIEAIVTSPQFLRIRGRDRADSGLSADPEGN